MLSSVADLAELGKMLEEHRPRLTAMLRRRIDGGAIDPEVILQETYLLARKKWARFIEDGRMRPYPWLYRLALDCLIAEWRRGGRHADGRTMPFPDQPSVQMGIGLVDPGTSPTQAAARNECQRLMREALALLQDNDRDILWMRHNDGLSLREAAAILDISAEAAAQRYVRALRRLKDTWQQMHPGTEMRP